jgi:hypothetical protein
MSDRHGVPQFSAQPHVVANDPGLYFRDHFGCLAYHDFQERDYFPHDIGLGDLERPYSYCNSKIEDFDLMASRAALLRLLMFQSYSNMETFIHTLLCGKHRGRMQRENTSFIRGLWMRQLQYGSDEYERRCDCCSQKSRPRWDAGMRPAERRGALAATASVPPMWLRRPKPSQSSCTRERASTWKDVFRQWSDVATMACGIYGTMVLI